MLRDNGQLVLPANIERNIAAPLDATMRVYTRDALIHPYTFASVNDNVNYAYVGMFTVVVGDKVQENNGLYILTKLPTTSLSNWTKLQTSTNANLNTSSKDVIGAINELNSKIGNYDTSNKTEINAGESALLFWNSTDVHLVLPEDSVESFKAEIVFISEDNDVLKKTLTFTSNTLNDNVIVSDAIIENNNIIGDVNFDVVLDLEIEGDNPWITLHSTANKKCTASIFLTRQTIS